MTRREYIDIPSDVVEELYDDHEAGLVEGFFYENDQIGDNGRWQTHHTMILRRAADDTLWGVSYSLGLTEMQDNTYPWRGEYSDPPETVVATRVYPHTKLVTEYWYTP